MEFLIRKARKAARRQPKPCHEGSCITFARRAGRHLLTRLRRAGGGAGGRAAHAHGAASGACRCRVSRCSKWHESPLSGWPALTHAPLPQVGLYERGQLYAPHFDAVEAHAPAGRLFLQNGGQRVATVLLYLCATAAPQACACERRSRSCLALRSDVEEGGETVFPAATDGTSPEKGALPVCCSRVCFAR